MTADAKDRGRQQVSDSGRVTLTWIAEQLRMGFSGKFEIDCHEGGVRNVRCQEALDPQEIKRRMAQGHSTP